MASVPQLDFHMSERMDMYDVVVESAVKSHLTYGNPVEFSRIHHLAKPKKIEDVWNFSRPLHVFSSNLESTIWEHPSDIYHTSERIRLLSEPRQYSTLYLEQRPRRSAVWPVSSSALSCKASQRLLDLSQPRNLSPSFIFPKEVDHHSGELVYLLLRRTDDLASIGLTCFQLLNQHKTRIKQSVRTAVASARIQRLAQPIVKKSNPCYENRYMEAPIRKVNLAALQTVATPRLVELSKAKALPPNSFPDRRAEWSVSQAAKKTVASPRLLELARCPTRASTNFVQFNPEAFTVTEAAKKARCTDRLNKLAEPILR